MKTTQETLLELKIADILLSFFEAYKEEDITQSDLQGVAQIRAMDIINLIKNHENH